MLFSAAHGRDAQRQELERIERTTEIPGAAFCHSIHIHTGTCAALCSSYLGKELSHAARRDSVHVEDVEAGRVPRVLAEKGPQFGGRAALSLVAGRGVQQDGGGAGELSTAAAAAAAAAQAAEVAGSMQPPQGAEMTLMLT